MATQTIKCNGIIANTGITPTGTINITSLTPQDVTNYAYAQIVDANLLASNIKSGVSILGITGSYAGGSGEAPNYYLQRYLTGNLNTITEETIGRPVSIGNYCFYNKSIYTLELPDSITSIGNFSFGNLSFYSGANTISLPNSIRTLYDGAFGEMYFSSSTPTFKVSDGLREAYGTSLSVRSDSVGDPRILYNGAYYLDSNSISKYILTDINASSLNVADTTKLIGSRAVQQSYKMIGIPASVDYIDGDFPSSAEVYTEKLEKPNTWTMSGDGTNIHYGATSKTYSFNTNGADTASPASYTGIILPESAKPENPTKTGKYFWGWYDSDWSTDTKGKNKVKFPLYRASATTFNARWEDDPLQDGMSRFTAYHILKDGNWNEYEINTAETRSPVKAFLLEVDPGETIRWWWPITAAPNGLLNSGCIYMIGRNTDQLSFGSFGAQSVDRSSWDNATEDYSVLEDAGFFNENVMLYYSYMSGFAWTEQGNFYMGGDFQLANSNSDWTITQVDNVEYSNLSFIPSYSSGNYPVTLMRNNTNTKKQVYLYIGLYDTVMTNNSGSDYLLTDYPITSAYIKVETVTE